MRLFTKTEYRAGEYRQAFRLSFFNNQPTDDDAYHVQLSYEPETYRHQKEKAYYLVRKANDIPNHVKLSYWRNFSEETDQSEFTQDKIVELGVFRIAWNFLTKLFHMKHN